MERFVLLMLIVIVFPIVIVTAGTLFIIHHKNNTQNANPVGAEEIQVMNATAASIYVSQQNKKGLQLIRESWEWTEREAKVIGAIMDPGAEAIEITFSVIVKKVPGKQNFQWAIKGIEELAKLGLFYRRTKDRKKAIKEVLKDNTQEIIIEGSLFAINFTFFSLLYTRQNIFIDPRQIYNR